MAKVEVPEEIRQPSAGVGQADVVIGIPGPVDLQRLQSLAAALPPALGHRAGSTGDAQQAPNGPGGGPEVVPEVVPGVVVLYPCPPGVANLTESEAEGVRFLSYDLRGATNPQLPWLGQAVAYEGLFNLAQQMQARACVVLNPDLLALTPHGIGALSAPVLSAECDLAMPLYPVGRFEGLLNRAVLAPLARALYGKRVRFPLAQDFAVSAPLMPILLQQIAKSKLQGQTLLWPATEAAVRDAKICQVYLEVHHEFSAEGVDLSAILNQVVGPLFFDMERHASAWQRTRGSQETLVRGRLRGEGKSDQVVDPRPMIEAFQLGHRNLQEVWSLVLPPITLLELKHLSRQPLESFSMSEQLWARVVYDFALAHRLRTLSRNHLLGALTPLYLGWVGSYVTQVSKASGDGASESDSEGSDGVDEGERRAERLARAFEETKPYLLQRWRWPDRFNP